MSQIVLDIGSGNTLTDEATAIKLVDEVIARDTHIHDVVFKTQLFQAAPPNKPLDHDVFRKLFNHCYKKGYHLTSSVFDMDSLSFLLIFDWQDWRLPFIKIACRPDKYWLIGEIPRRIPVYYSIDARWDIADFPELPDECNATELECIPMYPADSDDYRGEEGILLNKVSDHTIGWGMYQSAGDVKIWEKHICLERSPDNPDSGPFAVTPEDLGGIL